MSHFISFQLYFNLFKGLKTLLVYQESLITFFPIRCRQWPIDRSCGVLSFWVSKSRTRKREAIGFSKKERERENKLKIYTIISIIQYLYGVEIHQMILELRYVKTIGYFLLLYIFTPRPQTVTLSRSPQH